MTKRTVAFYYWAVICLFLLHSTAYAEAIDLICEGTGIVKERVGNGYVERKSGASTRLLAVDADKNSITVSDNFNVFKVDDLVIRNTRYEWFGSHKLHDIPNYAVTNRLDRSSGIWEEMHTDFRIVPNDESSSPKIIVLRECKLGKVLF